MAKLGMDPTNFLRRINAWEKSMAAAERDAVILLAREWVDFVLRIAPRDTNRYIRAWIMAANKSGILLYGLPPVQPSKIAALIEDRLDQQVGFWERQVSKWTYIVRRHERNIAAGVRKPDRWYRDAMTKLRRAEKTLGRAREELDRFRAVGGETIVIGVFDRFKAVEEKGRKLTASTRNNEAGGEGKFVTIGGRTFVQLTNKEAHARLVERKHRVARRGYAHIRSAAGRRAGRMFLRRLQGGGVGQWPSQAGGL